MRNYICSRDKDEDCTVQRAQWGFKIAEEEEAVNGRKSGSPMAAMQKNTHLNKQTNKYPLKRNPEIGSILPSFY